MALKVHAVEFGDVGSDLFHGGDRKAAGGAAGGLTADGIDSVSYAAVTSADPDKGIAIQIGGAAASKDYKTDPDFEAATFVTDLGRDGATDTLISIEKIIGTSADDVLTINKLDTERLADPASQQGGVAEIDLAGQTKATANKGDLVDLTGINKAVVITATGPSMTVAAKSDAAHALTIRNAEYVIGGTKNDLILMEGAGAAVEFQGDSGHDVFETGASDGQYDLLLKGLNPGDVSIIAGGEDLYNSYAYYDNIAFEFVAFKVNATGATIAITNKSKQVGTAGNPGYDQAGIAYATAHSAVSSVTFADGTTWTAADLWNRIADKANNPDVTWDLMFRSYGAERTEAGLKETKSDTYNAYVNATYFQADPIGSAQTGLRAAPAEAVSANDGAGSPGVSMNAADNSISTLAHKMVEAMVAFGASSYLGELDGAQTHAQRTQRHEMLLAAAH